MNYNVFDTPPEESAKLQHQLPDRCDDTIMVGSLEVHCRKTHFQGELLHEAMLNDDSGMRTLRLEWR